ncbi:MAG: hypothetical protein ACOYD0_00065 [Candidatus Nanopelagicales bacterium]
MSSPSDQEQELAQEETEASVDTAVESAVEHASERDANHRQGLIEKGTRDHELDED